MLLSISEDKIWLSLQLSFLVWTGLKSRYITAKSAPLFSLPGFWFMVVTGIKMDDPVDIGLELLSTTLDEVAWVQIHDWVNGQMDM